MTEKLTDDERKELEELRAQKNVTAEKTDDEKPTLPPTHWLWLANGEVIESNGVKSMHDGIPVVTHYAKPDELITNPAPAHVF